MLRKRLETIENYEIPESEFNFPSIPEGSIAAYTFSLSDGVRWRVGFIIILLKCRLIQTLILLLIMKLYSMHEVTSYCY